MSIYLTEEEQLATIVAWFKRYQRVWSIAIVMTIIVTSGLYYWSAHVARVQERRSIAYERLMAAMAQKDDKTIRLYAQQLSQDTASTVYRDTAHLALARYFVSQAEWENARNELQMVMRDSHTLAFKAVATLRLSRILFFEKKYQQAADQIKQLLAGPGAAFVDVAQLQALQTDIEKMIS